MIFINDVPMYCINQAAFEYGLKATMIISVLKTENGKVGQANKNYNGTFDYGPMQINTVWEKRLHQAGISMNDVQYNPCTNVKVGAWKLSEEIANSNNLWVGVGNYHSHTPHENQIYREKVYQKYIVLNSYLNQRV